MSTEKDREAAAEYGDKWEKEFCFEGITKAETADNVSQIFLKGIQHARQGEKERLKQFYYFTDRHFGKATSVDDMVDRFLEQEARR